MSNTATTKPATKPATKTAKRPRTPAELRREAERLSARAAKLAELAAERDLKRHRDRAAIVVGATLATHGSVTLKATMMDLLAEHMRPQDIDAIVGAGWADWAIDGYADAQTPAARTTLIAAAKAAAEARAKAKEPQP